MIMSFNDPSMALLAAGSELLAVSGGDTVKLFDVSSSSGGSHDPCTLTYTPSPGVQVNSVKWNHTNLVVASAGDDKKISLWRKNGQSMGTIPVAGSDNGDNIEESIMSINFSNKVSRYICSGGSGQVVRIWDLQRKRCIKWLRGHSDTITGAIYNCKDEHLASISVKGDLIVHNLASGARAAELKDPNEQVLRVLDYSRISRHFLATAGDDGSVHLWDTTGRSPKVSWLNQHSAPTAGLKFSPSNDKIIASVGLDKKLYTFDVGTRRPSFCIPYEAPFTSMAFRDDGLILAAGTSNGRVVFYDIRGKPQPLTVLRAYSSSEAVTSLCWQRSKHVILNESNCTAETALLGGALEDSILMPDPLPSSTSSGLSLSSSISVSRNPGRSGSSAESSSFPVASGASISKAPGLSTEEEASLGSSLWRGGTLARLHAPRSYDFKDDMEVFSPLVDVKPITPSLEKIWDGNKKDYEKNSSLLFPSSRRFPFLEEGSGDPHPVFDWKSSSISKQDDTRSSLSQSVSTPASFRSNDSTIITPPEAWGGEKLSDKSSQQRPPVTLPSRFAMLTSSSLTSGSTFSGLQGISPANLEQVPVTSTTLSLGSKGITGLANLESPASTWTIPRRFSTYAERISTTSSFIDGTSLSIGSPKTKKTGAETREELLNSLSRSDVSSVPEAGILPSDNGPIVQPPKIQLEPDTQMGSNFTLQLFQRTLQETLSSFQKSIHEDMRNLHIEILRQFHMQEMELSSVMNTILDNQSELMREVQSLRKENRQLRQLL